jgi:hypothetical protein
MSASEFSGGGKEVSEREQDLIALRTLLDIARRSHSKPTGVPLVDMVGEDLDVEYEKAIEDCIRMIEFIETK